MKQQNTFTLMQSKRFGVCRMVTSSVRNFLTPLLELSTHCELGFSFVVLYALLSVGGCGLDLSGSG
jgi:hypothetical protein